MIIDGRKIAEEVLGELKKEIESKKLKLRLAAVLVGNDPEFEKFVQIKGKKAEEIGIEYPIYQFPKDIETEELAKRVKEISAISDGALIELPLPEHIDQQTVLNQIPVDKDVDVLSSASQRRFYADKERGFDADSRVLPPAVEALKIVLDEFGVELKDKKVAVFGQGILVGAPVSYWLEKQGMEVFRIDSETKNPGQYSKISDLIVTGVGKPDLVTGDMVKNGVVVVDFGYGKKDNKMVGDIDFESVSSKALLITPVPGGMGPVLIVAVLKNLIKLYNIS